MAKVETDVMYFKDDVGKNLYRKRIENGTRNEG